MERKKQATRTAQSITASMKALHLRETDTVIAHYQANKLEHEASQLMNAPDFVRGAGEAIALDSENVGLVCTLENPSSIGLDASEVRLDLAADADVLEIGLDAAGSIAAANSIEKMLAHQFAASHVLAMKLAARAMDERLPPVEAARLSNASMRCMDTFQTAMLTLQRFRTGGQQRITVQHVQVNEGGQAIVAGGNVGDGGHRAGEVSKNE